MILSSSEIKKSLAAGEIAITPFDETLLKAASYTFTLGKGLRKLRLPPAAVGFIDTRLDKQEFDEIEIGQDGYLLRPGEFVICHTEETFKLGNSVACFLSMRGARAQAGLDALQCEIFCEPGSEGGWKGRLMLEISNRGPYPVKLFPGTKIVKGIFIKVV